MAPRPLEVDRRGRTRGRRARHLHPPRDGGQVRRGRPARLEKAVAAEAATDEWAPVVRAVSTIKGIDVWRAPSASRRRRDASRGSGPPGSTRAGAGSSERSSGESARPHNQDGERGLEEDARPRPRGTSPAARGPKRLPDGWEVPAEIGEAGQRLHEAPREEARRARGVGAQQVRRQRRRGQGARLLGLGDRDCRAEAPAGPSDPRIAPLPE